MPATNVTCTVNMSITKSVGFSTPLSNTGSSSFSSRLDWLQGVLRMPNSSLATFIETLSSLFRDSFAIDGGAWFCGRSFAHHRISDRSGRIAWNYIEDSDCDVFLILPAKFLAGIQSVEYLQKFLRDLTQYSFKPTRIDLAIDDHTKSISWQHFDAAFDAGHAHGFQDVDPHRPKSKRKDCGFTYYMGSRNSDKFHRFYDKSVESGGEIDAYRLEAQFKDDWAKSVFQVLLSAKSPSQFHQTIVNCVCSPIDFYSVNDDREKVYLDWWVNFKKMVKAGAVDINCGRLKMTIENSIDWVESTVETTLANIEAFLDRTGGDFLEWLNDRLESGRKRLKPVHQNKINAALAVLGIPDHISGDDLRAGYF